MSPWWLAAFVPNIFKRLQFEPFPPLADRPTQHQPSGSAPRPPWLRIDRERTRRRDLQLSAGGVSPPRGHLQRALLHTARRGPRRAVPGARRVVRVGRGSDPGNMVQRGSKPGRRGREGGLKGVRRRPKGPKGARTGLKGVQRGSEGGPKGVQRGSIRAPLETFLSDSTVVGSQSTKPGLVLDFWDRLKDLSVTDWIPCLLPRTLRTLTYSL
eukprot:1184720-Prorocentrum_minimum.AAC.3